MKPLLLCLILVAAPGWFAPPGWRGPHPPHMQLMQPATSCTFQLSSDGTLAGFERCMKRLNLVI